MAKDINAVSSTLVNQSFAYPQQTNNLSNQIHYHGPPNFGAVTNFGVINNFGGINVIQPQPQYRPQYNQQASMYQDPNYSTQALPSNQNQAAFSYDRSNAVNQLLYQADSRQINADASHQLLNSTTRRNSSLKKKSIQSSRAYRK